MVIFVNDDKDILPGDIKTFSSAEMGTIYKSDFDYEKGRPKPKPYDVSQTGYGGGAVNRIMRAGEDFYQSSYEAMKGFEVAYGQAKVAYGKHFADSDSADEWIESGKALQQAALRDLEIRRKEYEENKTYLPPQVENSTSQGIINAAVQYLPQIPIAYATGGVGPVIIVGAQSFGGAEAEGIMTAAKRGQLEEFLGQPENELTLNAFRGVTNAALEKVGGVFEQIKIAQKLKKLNSPTAFNKVLAAGEVGLKAGVSEGITEALQGVSDIYYDSLLNRFENDAELKDAFEQNIKGAFYAMAIAAPIGTAGNIYYRRKAKQNIIDGLSQTDMTETEKERFADAFVQKQMIDGQTAAVKAVDYSEQLRNKHGEIYDALYGAIAKAADDAGAYVDLNETQKAQLLSDTARRFSDEAIAESVKRNTSVENVINAKEIKYVGNGAFQLEDTKGSSDNTTKESGNKLPAGQTDETTTSTTNTPKTNNNSDHVNKENENILYQEDMGLGNPIDLTETFSNVRGKTPEQTAQHVEEYLNDLIKKGGMETATKPLQVQVTKENKAHVVRSNTKLKGRQKEQHDTALLTLEKIINNAVKNNKDGTVDLNHNTRKQTLEHKSKVEQYVYFDSPVRINNQDYRVSLTTEQVKGQDPNLLDLYNVHVKRGMLPGKRTFADHPSLNFNIPQVGEDVNRENENILGHNPRSVKRAFYDRNSHVIKLLQDATPASLPHEFAHYWLDNITAYVNSGQASETYLNTFYQPIVDYLGEPKWSNGFSRAQHEKFAASYEKYLYNGNLPTPLLGTVFDDYDKWLKDVYDSAEAITISGTTKKPVLTPEIIAFFRSMTTGKLETAPALNAIAKQAENQQIAKEAVETEAEARAYVQAETEAFNTTSESSTDPAIDVQNALRTIDAQTQAEAKAETETQAKAELPAPIETQAETSSESKQKATIQPIQGPGETAGTRYYERVKERLGLTDSNPDSNPTRNRMRNADEQAKAAALWRTNPERAQQILDSGDMSNEVLRNALYTEYQKIMLASGNINAWHESVQQQSWEATRAGQEMQYLRGAANDITNPAYWVRQTESNLTDALANKMSTVLSGDPNKSRPQQLALELDKDIQVLTQKILDVDPKDRNKLFQEELTRLQKKYAGNQQNKVKQVVLPEFSAEKQGRKYIEKQAQKLIERKTKEAIGIALTAEQTNTIVQKAQTIDKLFKKTDALGLPDVDFFKAVKDLENYVNGIMPSGAIKVLTSIIGRAGMLSSPATYVMNGVSNAVNLVDTTLTHRLKNIMTGHTNDTIVDKNLVDAYKQKIKDVFWETGQDITLMDSFVDDILYRGEKLRTHAQGAGFIRWLGRAAEKLVFQRMMSHPDTVFRARTYFTNILNNEATQQAYQEGLTGDTAKQRANSLFIEATHLQPQSEEARMIRQKARAESLYATFQQDSLLSETLLGLREKINKGLDTVGLGGAADAMFPFVKTPANVIDSGLDALFGPFRNPKNLIGAIQDKRAGLTDQESKRIDKAVRSTAHMIPGWILAILAVSLLDDDDYIPDYLSLSAKDRKIIQEKAGAFGAIKVGNYWMNTDYLGSLEIPLTAFLEYKNANAVWDNLRSMAGGVITKAIDTPVIREIADTIEALKQVPGGRAKIDDVLTNSLGNYITAAVPNILNTLAKSLDDYERDTERDVWKKIEAKIPGFRESLKPKTSEITGKPIQTQHWLITTLFGSRVHTDSKDPAVNMYYQQYKAGETPTTSDITKRGQLSLLSESDKSKIRKRFTKEFTAEQRRIQRLKLDAEDKKEALNKARQQIIAGIKKDFKKKIDAAKKRKGK